MFRFGLIGCGTISKAYGNAIARLESARIDSVYDIIPERGIAFAEKYGTGVSSSFEEMLATDIDAVCVCLPSGLHVPYAVQAARAGKHVMVEKPLGITVAQLNEIETVARETGMRIGAISQLFFADGFQRVKRAVDEGRLGKLYLIDVSMKYYRTAEYFKAGGWRGTWAMDGGGALMNQGIHGISLMLHLMGPVRSISAQVRTLAHEIEVEDTALATIEFESGAMGHVLGTTSIAPGYRRHISVHGEKGSVGLCEENVELWDLPGESLGENAAADVSAASDPSAFGNELHRRQIAEFIEAVECGRDPRLSIREGREAVETILGIYESSRTGRAVHPAELR